MRIEVSVEASTFYNALNSFIGAAASPLEMKIQNDTPYIGAVEYGSGVYSEQGSKGIIFPRFADYLIIPVMKKYVTNKALPASLVEEARNNAKKYPSILLKLSKYPSLIGFIFRRSNRGQKPVRMVRNSDKVLEKALVENLIKYFEQTNGSRSALATAINNSGQQLYYEIIRRTPYLKGDLLSGWKIVQTAS